MRHEKKLRVVFSLPLLAFYGLVSIGSLIIMHLEFVLPMYKGDVSLMYPYLLLVVQLLIFLFVRSEWEMVYKQVQRWNRSKLKPFGQKSRRIRERRQAFITRWLIVLRFFGIIALTIGVFLPASFLFIGLSPRYAPEGFWKWLVAFLSSPPFRAWLFYGAVQIPFGIFIYRSSCKPPKIWFEEGEGIEFEVYWTGQ